MAMKEVNGMGELFPLDYGKGFSNYINIHISRAHDVQNEVEIMVDWLVGWLVGFLWHINLCRLFNTKSIFIQISFISDNSIYHQYTV